MATGAILTGWPFLPRDLTDGQWALIGPFLPAPARRIDGEGARGEENRAVLNGIVWILRTGAHGRTCQIVTRRIRPAIGVFNNGGQGDGRADAGAEETRTSRWGRRLRVRPTRCRTGTAWGRADRSSPTRPQTKDAGWPTASPISAAVEGGTAIRVDSELPTDRRALRASLRELSRDATPCLLPHPAASVYEMTSTLTQRTDGCSCSSGFGA